MQKTRFSELLQKTGKSASDVARETGISTGLLSYYKHGTKMPSAANLQKIADYFGVSTDYLLGRDEKAPAPEEPEQEQDAIDAEFADRVSRLSKSGREALSQYLDLLLRREGKP